MNEYNLNYIHRSTFQTRNNSQEINFSKLESSFKANFIHSIDAYIIRKFTANSKGNVVIIHDSFGCELLYIEDNINIMKNCYSEINFTNSHNKCDLTIKTNIHSNFIML